MIPIESYLIELLSALEPEGFSIIVAGGLGIYLKRRWVQETNQTTFIAPLPDARTTEDIDSFLHLDIFLQNDVERFRFILNRLDYKATEKGKYFQFAKPAKLIRSEQAKFDLHARLPGEDESARIKQRQSGKLVRLGSRNDRLYNTLNAWGTAEAFAVEDDVQSLPLSGTDPSGQVFTGIVRVPHPFASLCMKLRAAADHERMPFNQRNARDRRHAVDVYVLAAMLGAAEVEVIRRLTKKYETHPEQLKCQTDITAGFANVGSGGCQIIRDELRGQPGEPSTPDLQRFCALLRELFG